MNPIEKWHARRRFPWKLLLQIFKIVVVTAQVSPMFLIHIICIAASKKNLMDKYCYSEEVHVYTSKVTKNEMHQTY